MKKIIIWLIITILASSLVGYISFNQGHDAGYHQGYSNTPINMVEISGIAINKLDGRYRFTVTSGNSTFTAVEMPDKPILFNPSRDYYLNDIALPSDYPENVSLPYSSSVEFPDGLKITTEFYNTERYKNQWGTP